MMPIPGRAQAMPGQGAPAPSGPNNPIDQNRSVLNPTDMAYMKSAGAGGEMTIEDLVTNVLRVPGGTQAPVSSLVQALRKQSENAQMSGKMKNMAMGMGQKPAPQGPPMGMMAGRRPAPAGMGANTPAPGGGGPPANLGALLSSIRPNQ